MKKKNLVLIAKALFPQRLFPIPEIWCFSRLRMQDEAPEELVMSWQGEPQYLFLTFNGISGIYIN